MAHNLSDDEILILEGHRKSANGITAKLNAVKTTGPVAITIEMICSRIVGAGNSLAVLYNNSPHDYAFEAASILRNIYDIMLQGLYIMGDSSRQKERAQLFLDFTDVERMRRIEIMDASGTSLARQVSGSCKRAKAEPAIKKRFDDVKGKYLTKKGRVQNKWYSGTLCDLAKATDLEMEYDLMQKFLSAVVHSSPLTLTEGPFVRGFLLVDWHWQFAFRVLGAYAEYKGIALNQTETDLVVSSSKNVFNLP